MHAFRPTTPMPQSSNNVKAPSAQLPRFWVVVDVRVCLLTSCPKSGIARYVQGLCGALGELFQGYHDHPVQRPEMWGLLLVGHSLPPEWVLDLTTRFPAAVSYWMFRPEGFSWLGAWADKPTWLWPTRVFSRVREVTGHRFVWIAPANFDRPLSILSRMGFGAKKQSPEVVQIVHDTIPFFYAKQLGQVFSWQFRNRVRRALTRRRLVTVVTPSLHTKKQLQMLCAQPDDQVVNVIGGGVAPQFGTKQRYFGDSESRRLRRGEILAQLVPEQAADFQNRTHWIVGVGREESYKNWGLIHEAFHHLGARFPLSEILFIRVGGAPRKQIHKDKKKPDLDFILNVSSVSDSLLAQIYAVSDLAVHPSAAEGFGFPPLEACYAGCPVLFKKGTAIDDHFSKVLPHPFHVLWNALDSLLPQEWGREMARILEGFSASQPEYLAVKKSFELFWQQNKTPRQVLVEAAGDLPWSAVAARLMGVLTRGRSS